MRLYVATGNAGKLREMRDILQPRDIEVLPAPEGFNVVEDGTTFADNAVKKAQALAARVGDATLGDDSGLEVNALGGAPGIYSARYSGVSGAGQDAANRRKLLSALTDLPWHERSARFVCVVALCVPQEEPLFFEGSVTGHIGLQEAGTHGFGYDALFVPDATPGRTMAQLAPEEKHALSHRGRALGALLRHLQK